MAHPPRRRVVARGSERSHAPYQKIVTAALAATGVAAGIGLSTGVALGDASPSPSVTSEQDAPDSDNGGDNGLHFTSSVTAPQTETADETGEPAALLPLAKIDAVPAKGNESVLATKAHPN
ncbi:MAG: hypothetical protein ABJA34_10080 [Pseudonocardiales bacterium]